MKPVDMKVLLTGATGGIGLKLASILAVRGAHLLLTGRDEERLEHLKHRLLAKGRAVEAIAADVSTQEGLRSVASTARRFHGGINVLVNNAGINRFGLLEDQSDEDLHAIFSTNVLAPMLLTQELIPLLRNQNEGLIVNIGSIIGSIGIPGQVAYSSSKFALHGFSEALRRELGGGSVKVVYVAPRSTDTDMNNTLSREINEKTGVATDDSPFVAKQIADAITAERRERFIGWPERLFVKLNALFPGLVDRSLQGQTKLLEIAAHDTQSLTMTDGVKQ